MTYGVTVDVAAPGELYDALHAALLQRTGAAVSGLLVHLARQTDDGFQVTEVWESQAEYERYVDDVLTPVLQELSGGHASRDQQTERPFEVRGLVLPGVAVAV
jgi:hypothetical protein